MVAVHREAGFGFIIPDDDHPPAQAQVVGDGTMKIGMAAPDGLPFIVARAG